MAVNFRLLRADEIEVRIASCNKGGVQLLLYKNARVDANILDEALGAYGWKKRYTRDNRNCIISIWDSEKNCWIDKEDTGTESYSEAEKGLASDSFKRAGFAWGIGRELYTAPNIFIFASELASFQNDGVRCKCYDSFRVIEVVYNVNRTIKSVLIENIGTHKSYRFENPDLEYRTIILEENPVAANTTAEAPKNYRRITKKQQQELLEKCNKDAVDIVALCNLYKVNSIGELTTKYLENIYKFWNRVVTQCVKTKNSEQECEQECKQECKLDDFF